MPSSFPLDVKIIGVIVGLDLVGDALIKLPFARALRAAFPKAQIHWITSKGPTAYNGPLRELTWHLIDVIHEQPDWLTSNSIQHSASSIQESGTDGTVGTFDKTLNAECQMLNAPFFDILIDTRNRWRDARIARRAVAHGLFLATAARYLISDRRPPLLLPRPPHLVDRLLQLVELAAGYVPPSTGRLPVPEILLTKARRLLPEENVYLGLAPGAGNPVKIWPRKRFEKLAAMQAAKGRVPVFLLGPQEQDWQTALRKNVPTALFPLQARDAWETPCITLEQTMAIGSLLNAAVTNDSGTGHMLAAVDCPLVSLFGPTSPAKLAPRVSNGAVIRAQDFGGEAMDAIPVEAVNDVVNRMLGS